jgi:hypothetical protein
MRLCKLFTHVSKMAILTYKRANSVTVNNVMILNITHNVFNLDDTEVFIYIYYQGHIGQQNSLSPPCLLKCAYQGRTESDRVLAC